MMDEEPDKWVHVVIRVLFKRDLSSIHESAVVWLRVTGIFMISYIFYLVSSAYNN